MTNERLRSALAARALTVDAVAARAGVDPKTVQRWLAGRTPHTRHRWTIAALVREDEAYLWPTVVSRRRGADAGQTELVALYPHRSDVPPALWRTLLDEARSAIAILVYAATFLPEQQLDLVDVLRAKAAAGCAIRIALGDPTSAKLLERGSEEKFGIGIVSRAEVALKHYELLRDCPGVEVRLHATTLYNSMYRFDDVMLVNTHVWGLSAFGAPVLHLRRLVDGGLFDTYAQSFEAVWATGTPAYPAMTS
jgi:transcriptional regulator with XRE-family HTH domain